MNIKKYTIAIKNNPSSLLWRIFNTIRKTIPFDYWFLKGWSFPPDIITILITKKCNYLCEGCSSASPAYTKKGFFKELETKEIKKFIDSISWFKPSIYFNGGEPLLRKDIFELIRYCKEKKLITALTTNGSLLTKNNIEMLLNSGLDFLSVSLDGSKEHHDKYRGHPGAFLKLTRGLEMIVREKKSRNLNKPNIRISCIINPSNKNDAIYVAQKATSLGVDEVAFGNLMFYPISLIEKQKKVIKKFHIGGNHMIGMPIGNKFPFSLDLDRLGKVYEEIKLKSKIPVTFVPKNINYYDFFSYKDISSKTICLSPWFIASLLPDGNLSTCQEFISGNISSNSFLSLWNTKKMRDFREYRKKMPFPACFRCIEGQEIIFD